MKKKMMLSRFWWMLALPYMVVYSSGPNREYVTIKAKDSKADYGFMAFECPPDYKCGEFGKDLAAALNEAHERRENKSHLVCGDIGAGSLLCTPNTNPYLEKNKKETWKDSKKADWQNGEVITTNPPKYITNKEACGQDDCGEEPK